MKLTVLGASGGTRQQLARQAIAAGHEVTAIVRRPDAIPAPDPQLRLVPGDLLNPQWTGEGTVRQTKARSRDPADALRVLIQRDVVLTRAVPAF